MGESQPALQPGRCGVDEALEFFRGGGAGLLFAYVQDLCSQRGAGEGVEVADQVGEAVSIAAHGALGVALLPGCDKALEMEGG